MDNLFVHYATIQTRDASENDFGEQTYTWADTYTDVLCRFSSPKGGKIRLDSGEFVTDAPKISFKAVSSAGIMSDQDVSENCRIVGVVGFTHTYRVMKVNTRYDGNGIHHTDCDLEKVI